MTEALPDATNDRLFHSATALLISNGTGAVLGVGFYVVAAHLYSQTDVGYGAAEVSAMLLIASVAQLNLPVVFPRFLFTAGAQARRLLYFGYAASTAVALAAGAIFLVSFHHAFIPAGPWPSFFFLAAIPLWVWFSLQDAALIGLRTTFWIPVENTSFSIMKILLLPVLLAVTPRQGVFLSYVAPVVLCIAAISTFLFGKVLPDHLRWSAGRVALPSRRAVSSMMGGEYVAGLAYIALQFLPTLLVATELGPKAAAHFQTPWLAGTSIDFALYYVATSVISESSARPREAPAIVRRAVRFTAWVLLPLTVVLALGAHYFLEILGNAYAVHATTLLRLLAAALPLLAINVLYLTFARLGRRVRRIIAMPVCGNALILVGSALLVPHLGITGVGIAFLCGQAAVTAAILPSVLRQYRRRDMAPGFASDQPLVVRGLDEASLPSADGHAARVTVPARRATTAPDAAATERAGD